MAKTDILLILNLLQRYKTSSQKGFYILHEGNSQLVGMAAW